MPLWMINKGYGAYSASRNYRPPPLGPGGGWPGAVCEATRGVAKKSKILKMCQPAGCRAKSFKKEQNSENVSTGRMPS